MSEATFIKEVVPVTDKGEVDGYHWLEISVTGWDDVKTHTKKILEYQGREYGWSCWNSDRMVSVFRSPAPRSYGEWKKGKA